MQVSCRRPKQMPSQEASIADGKGPDLVPGVLAQGVLRDAQPKARLKLRLKQPCSLSRINP